MKLECILDDFIGFYKDIPDYEIEYIKTGIQQNKSIKCKDTAFRWCVFDMINKKKSYLLTKHIYRDLNCNDDHINTLLKKAIPSQSWA